MTIDHVTDLFYPSFPAQPLPIALHVIGRLTAPIMWFFIAEGYHYTHNIKKYLLRLGIFAVISATAASLPVLVSPALLWPAFGIEAVAVILLLVIAYRRLVKKQFFEQLSKTVSKRRGVWLHHLGIELLVWTFCLLVILSLSIVTTLPMLIVMAANWINQAGTLSGDPNGMPAYMTWLTVIVFLIAGFIQAYVWLTLLAPLYLMHGSIAQKEKEREEFKKKAKKINNQKYEQNLIYRP